MTNSVHTLLLKYDNSLQPIDFQGPKKENKGLDFKFKYQGHGDMFSAFVVAWLTHIFNLVTINTDIDKERKTLIDLRINLVEVILMLKYSVYT